LEATVLLSTARLGLARWSTKQYACDITREAETFCFAHNHASKTNHRRVSSPKTAKQCQPSQTKEVGEFVETSYEIRERCKETGTDE